MLKSPTILYIYVKDGAGRRWTHIGATCLNIFCLFSLCLSNVPLKKSKTNQQQPAFHVSCEINGGTTAMAYVHLLEDSSIIYLASARRES